jgi:NHLM bacteriocin system ABC transporter peptidase/ATP-binding protein
MSLRARWPRTLLAGGRRVKTPTILQMEAVECGAAALGIVLAYYGRRVPLEELRLACGVSRDGSKASTMVRAARGYGMTADGYRHEPGGLAELPLPLIVFWNFNHFVVVEGFGKDKVYLNDPATGPRVVSSAEFDQSFTGVVLVCEPGPEFRRGGRPPSVLGALSRRLAGYPDAVLYAVVTGLALVALGLAVPAFSRVFVDRILIAGQDWIVALLIGMGLTALLRATVTWLQQHVLLRLETGLAVNTSSAYLWHLLSLPIPFFAQRYAGDISARVAINDRVARLLAGDLANAALNLLVIGFFALVMLQYDPLLTAFSVAIALLNVLALRYVSRRRVDGSQRLQMSQSQLVGTTVQGIQTIETVKASAGEADFFARWAGYHAKLLNERQHLGLVTQTSAAVPVLLTAFNTAAILTLGGLRVMEGALTLGMLVAFQSLMTSFLEPVNKLVTLGGTVQTASADMLRLDDVLRYPRDPLASDLTAPEPLPDVAQLEGYLELKGVTFGYSRLATPLIEDFDLVLRPGQRVALVGPSGSGKSTVSRLVAGLYEPWAGEILFDGRPRSAIPRRVLTRSVAMVDQDIALFHGSVRENLTLWDATIAEADVVQAAKDAAIHDDIAVRHGSYEHLVEESGRNFSGGQRQRLEIARGLAGNPRLLILDEATSALDPLVEQEIDGALRRRGCTCLIVAHRLSTIRDCDEIIVLERGKVVQRGTHESMIRVPGPYATLLRTEEYQQQDRRRAVLERL